jgi:hypothetical protein
MKALLDKFERHMAEVCTLQKLFLDIKLKEGFHGNYFMVYVVGFSHLL